ncbi:hypothetical protein KI387_007654, partial [Taxus chinensis]
PEPLGLAETVNFSTEIVSPEVRGGCGEPKELKANQIMPRVISRMRDKEARIGWNGGIFPR